MTAGVLGGQRRLCEARLTALINATCKQTDTHDIHKIPSLCCEGARKKTWLSQKRAAQCQPDLESSERKESPEDGAVAEHSPDSVSRGR